MSIQSVGYVLDHSPSRGLCRLVLISIANHANRHGASCHPSIELIADEAGVGRATAWRCIEKLEADGEIIVRRARGRSHKSEYVLPMGRDPEACCVLFDDPEALVDGEQPRRRGRPPKVPERNFSDDEKVSQRNKKVPPRMELLEGFDEDHKSSIKVPNGATKSSIPSRALRSIEGTVNKPLEPSSSSTEDEEGIAIAFCEITNAEYSEMPTATVATLTQAASQLLASYSRADIEACMRWLQTWRRVPWTMATVRKEIDDWIATGRRLSGRTEPPAPRPNGVSQTVVGRNDGARQREMIGR